VRPVNCSSARAAKTRSETAAASRIVSISPGSLIARSRSTRLDWGIVSTPPSRSCSFAATVSTCASIQIVFPASRFESSPMTARAVCWKRMPSMAFAFWA
jgi:hypothetical protein